MTSTSAPPFDGLRLAGRFMVAVGALMLLLTVADAGAAGTGGALVLGGASILMPPAERAVKIGLAAAGAALAVASLLSYSGPRARRR